MQFNQSPAGAVVTDHPILYETIQQMHVKLFTQMFTHMHLHWELAHAYAQRYEGAHMLLYPHMQ